MMLKINSLTANRFGRTLVMGPSRAHGMKKIASAALNWSFVMYSAYDDFQPSVFALSTLVRSRKSSRVRRARLVWGTF